MHLIIGEKIVIFMIDALFDFNCTECKIDMENSDSD